MSVLQNVTNHHGISEISFSPEDKQRREWSKKHKNLSPHSSFLQGEVCSKNTARPFTLTAENLKLSSV